MIPINIWIVEDDGGYRRNLQRSLGREEHITCSRVFPSCIPFLEAIQEDTHPDLVLMDLGLPEMGGVEGIQRLKEIAPDVTVIVLTVMEDKEKVLQSLDAGAAGYLLKSSTIREIVDGLQQVFVGGAALSPGIAKIVLEELKKPAPDEFGLTDREIEVLELLAEGLSVKEIAAKLDVSRATAAFHLGNIYQKLNVQSQTGAVAKALRAGII
ncbi:response regulator transcription factor [Pontiella sulfatireligans]|uniref:Transcriptional regulatory protein DegU n=1 Tax=Pontiella sulfatireligans TaxID=2750658 RepID=A0A6C2UK14_9BACT|nr:response regulator transcription factor [Pontiella sulfatireligans]VGO20438.1 Transcriptional regulatory protein DegU [Pontiella sulfatireligans]